MDLKEDEIEQDLSFKNEDTATNPDALDDSGDRKKRNMVGANMNKRMTFVEIPAERRRKEGLIRTTKITVTTHHNNRSHHNSEELTPPNEYSCFKTYLMGKRRRTKPKKSSKKNGEAFPLKTIEDKHGVGGAMNG